MANHRGTDDAKRRAIGARLTVAWSESLYKDDTLAQIGKRIGVSYQSVKNWTDGEKLPGTDHMIALAKLFNISLDWLLLNRGSMRPAAIKGEAVFIGDWPENAKSVVKGFAALYSDAEGMQDNQKEPKGKKE